jgi:hypothetical protein
MAPIELRSTKTKGAPVASSIGKASMSARSPMTLPPVWFTSAHMAPKSRLMRAIAIAIASVSRDLGTTPVAQRACQKVTFTLISVLKL